MPIYVGEFRSGRYDGAGKEYSDDGSLLYEGEYLLGAYHGTGKLYHTETGEIVASGVFYHGVLLRSDRTAEGESQVLGPEQPGQGMGSDKLPEPEGEMGP